MASQGPPVNSLALSKLTEQVRLKAEATKEKGRVMLQHREDYCNLTQRLESLSDVTQHKVMVPMTSKAFMPGKLVHTNEILVLLGDNWFVETSAKNAAAIAQRRVKGCDEILDNLQQELELEQGWRKQVGEFSREKDECVEITEDFDPETERLWREKHRDNRRKEKLSAPKTQSDEELWQRLEELEIEEALEKQWEADGDEEDSDDDDDDESDISSNESEITNESESEGEGEPTGDTGLSVTNLGLTEAKTIKRRVSWGNLVGTDTPSPALEPLRTIKFQHSASNDPQDPQERKHYDQNSLPETPADLIHFSCRKPKSILKATDSEILVREEEDKTIRPVSPRQIRSVDCEPAVQENITERNISNQTGLSEAEEPVRKVSKFKAARLKSKQ